MTSERAVAGLKWLSDEAPKLWWQPVTVGARMESAHLEVRRIADDALAALAAARGEPPEPGLDVERLARAILVSTQQPDWRRSDDAFEIYDSADAMAADFAAEYATPATPTTPEPDPER